MVSWVAVECKNDSRQLENRLPIGFNVGSF